MKKIKFIFSIIVFISICLIIGLSIPKKLSVQSDELISYMEINTNNPPLNSLLKEETLNLEEIEPINWKNIKNKNDFKLAEKNRIHLHQKQTEQNAFFLHKEKIKLNQFINKIYEDGKITEDESIQLKNKRDLFKNHILLLKKNSIHFQQTLKNDRISFEKFIH